MTVTSTYARQPTKFDYASPTQFKFQLTKLPKVEYFCTAANIPGISIPSPSQPTPLADIPLPGDTISPGDLEEILGEFHGNVTSAFATEIQDAVMSGGVLGGYGSVGSIPELSTENFEQNYKSGAIKTSKIRNKYGAYNLSDDPIFQWTQDFFNDAKRSFKENHGS